MNDDAASTSDLLERARRGDGVRPWADCWNFTGPGCITSRSDSWAGASRCASPPRTSSSKRSWRRTAASGSSRAGRSGNGPHGCGPFWNHKVAGAPSAITPCRAKNGPGAAGAIDGPGAGERGGLEARAGCGAFLPQPEGHARGGGGPPGRALPGRPTRGSAGKRSGLRSPSKGGHWRSIASAVAEPDPSAATAGISSSGAKVQAACGGGLHGPRLKRQSCPSHRRRSHSPFDSLRSFGSKCCDTTEASKQRTKRQTTPTGPFGRVPARIPSGEASFAFLSSRHVPLFLASVVH